MLSRLIIVWLVIAASASAAEPVRVGSKAFTESVILGETLSHLLRECGYTVDHKSEMGTRMIFDALRSGKLDVYPEYTGTITAELFADEPLRTDDAIREKLATLGIGMTERLGFSNNYALGVKRANAEKWNLKRISDLARNDDAIRKLRCGFSNEFMNRRDGWEGLKEKYLLPQQATAIDHNLAYRGMERGSLDLTDLFSTDAEIRSYDLTLLEDDRGFFPIYHCVVLYRLDWAQSAPEALAAVQRIAGRIDNATMVEMNARVRIDRVSETRVAAEFLHESLQLDIPLPADQWLTKIVRNLIHNTQRHILLVFASLAAAVFTAVPLGITAAKYPRVGQAILGVVGVVQTLPSLAVLALLVPLLGLGAQPVIFALFLYSLLPIVRGTYAGLTEIAPNLLESAVVLGLPEIARLRLVELPLASRAILSGIKTAAVINVGTATIGGLIGAGGYGEPIMTGIRLADTSLLLQGAIPAAALAVLVQGLFEFSERWLVPAGLRGGNG